MRPARILVSVALAVALVAATAAITVAGPHGTDRPFRGSATGISYWTGANPLGCGFPFFETTFGALEGETTHLGKVHVSTMHCPIIESGTGVIEFTAPNGDLLKGTYELTLYDVPPDLEGSFWGDGAITFDPAASTGRFAGATGTASWYVVIEGQGLDDAEWPLSFSWSGAISY